MHRGVSLFLSLSLSFYLSVVIVVLGIAEGFGSRVIGAIRQRCSPRSVAPRIARGVSETRPPIPNAIKSVSHTCKSTFCELELADELAVRATYRNESIRNREFARFTLLTSAWKKTLIHETWFRNRTKGASGKFVLDDRLKCRWVIICGDRSLRYLFLRGWQLRTRKLKPLEDERNTVCILRQVFYCNASGREIFGRRD